MDGASLVDESRPKANCHEHQAHMPYRLHHLLSKTLKEDGTVMEANDDGDWRPTAAVKEVDDDGGE
jgi:hypothetical protein